MIPLMIPSHIYSRHCPMNTTRELWYEVGEEGPPGSN